jgi:hypothetical protein
MLLQPCHLLLRHFYSFMLVWMHWTLKNGDLLVIGMSWLLNINERLMNLVPTNLCRPGTSVIVSSVLLALVLIGRAAFVFPLSFLSNLTKKSQNEKISFRKQVCLDFCQQVFFLRISWAVSNHRYKFFFLSYFRWSSGGLVLWEVLFQWHLPIMRWRQLPIKSWLIICYIANLCLDKQLNWALIALTLII